MSNDLTNLNYVKDLQNCLRIFDSEQGKTVMSFLESIGGWTPNVFDTLETNEVIARDANRRLIGTIKTLMTVPPDAIVQMAKKEE